METNSGSSFDGSCGRLAIYGRNGYASLRLLCSALACGNSGCRLYWASRPAMRFVQALYWLRDMIPSNNGSIRKRLVSILKDADHAQAIQDDLRGGLHALPEWMRGFTLTMLEPFVNASVPT